MYAEISEAQTKAEKFNFVLHIFLRVALYRNHKKIAFGGLSSRYLKSTKAQVFSIVLITCLGSQKMQQYTPVTDIGDRRLLLVKWLSLCAQAQFGIFLYQLALNSWNELDVCDTEALVMDVFPLKHREIWVNLLTQYNTSILPYSAAVERLFRVGSAIMSHLLTLKTCSSQGENDSFQE